jgi:hypothetical protein
MNFEKEMLKYFKIRGINERKKKLDEILSQLEKLQKHNYPINSLNIAEVVMEYGLLTDNNNERLLKYDYALDIVQNTRQFLKEKNQLRQLLRSYHLECFIKYYAMKYKDEEEAYIEDIFVLGGKIIEMVTYAKKSAPHEEYKEYHSLGYVWRAYGHILQLIHKSKELSLKQKHIMAEKSKKLAHKALELGNHTNNRDARILSAYIFAFEYLPKIALRGDKATTEEDYLEFMRPYEILFEVARTYGSIEFEYLALLNYVQLDLGRVTYSAGVSERKSELFNKILDDCKKLAKYEEIIRIPHLQFYNYVVRTNVYVNIVYFEAIWEKKFNYYINKALESAEKLMHIYASGGMKAARERVEMHHILINVYKMKASFVTSQKEKLEYLKKCEDLLTEDEKTSVTWSPQVYSTWRDLSSIYLDLSKVEHEPQYFERCVFYAKKAYESAIETENFMDSLFEAYKIAIVAEDYQDYELSMIHYELGLRLIDAIIQAGKNYPYYHGLKTYLQARLLGVKAKQAHLNGNYAQAMNLYRNSSSLLLNHVSYSYEGLLYNAYSLFEKASMCFIEEEYKDTLNILEDITRLFYETSERHANDYETQFQYFIDRRAYDLQQLFFESSKTFCIAQSNILKALIYRNTGDSEKVIELLKKANAQLTPLKDRNIHIAGYYSFANGLYGLEKSELEIRNGDYKSAASYLASASDQFENASHVLVSDEQLRKLCDGLKFFCRGWMFALEIMRRDIDHSPIELQTNFNLANQSFVNANRYLKMFKKMSKGVSGFEELVNYIYYSLLFQKTEDPTEKNTFKDKMKAALSEALQYFKLAEDMERSGFVRDLIVTLPQLKVTDEKVFKPITIPFTPYTPVFDTTTRFDPIGINFDISLEKDQAEVNEEIRYSIEITSDTSVYLKQIDGILPKKGLRIVLEPRLMKKGIIEINRFIYPNTPIEITFKVQASTPFYKRMHPRLIFLNIKKEKRRVFTSPFTLQVYPKNTLKTGIVNEINEKVGLVAEIIKKLGIKLGEFPIIYHDTNSYREALAEYYFRYEIKNDDKKHLQKKTDISKIPIQQMAFVDPLGEVNVLYDQEKYLYPQSISNLLGIIIHEKFGHGFFHQFTALGKKLLELEYHHKGTELLMKELEKISNKYATGIQWLAVSTLIVDEGFATWLELNVFRKMLETISDKDSQFIQQIKDEIKNFKKMVFESEELNVKHDYFALKYEKPIINPYAFGYDLFLQIEEKYGEKCVPKALEIAANVSLTRRQISLMPNTIKNDKNCADKRLEIIAYSDLKIERNNVNMFEKAVLKLFS